MAAAMDRRHLIVHQSDRLARGSNHGYVRNISSDEVKSWLTAISDFGDELLRQIATKVIKKKTKARIQ